MEYSTEDYKSPKINIGTLMRNPEMLFLITLKLKRCLRMQLKNCLL